jgi:hypothetical protein
VFYYNTGLTIDNTFSPTEIARLNATGLGVGVTPAYKLQVQAANGEHIGLSQSGLTALGFIQHDVNATYMSSNALFTGGVWARQDTAAPSMTLMLHRASGNIQLRYAAAGVGAITWTTPLTADATKVLLDVPLKHKSYTVASAPSAATLGAGTDIYVSNGAAGSPVRAFSDGTNWLRCDTLAAISAS